MSFFRPLFWKLRPFLVTLLIVILFHASESQGTSDKGPPIQIPFGTITQINGEVSVNGQPARPGMRVFQGDYVVTREGKIEITAEEASILIGPSSEIKLGPPPGKKRSNIHVQKGTLRSIIRRLLHGGFSVMTQNAVLGVRGTDLLLLATPKASAVFVKEGTISFTAGGDTIRLDQVMMSQGGEGIAPLAPEAIESNEELTRLVKDVEQFCDLTIPPGFSKKKDLNNIVARWNLNYASYMVDRGEFQEARKLCSLGYFVASLKRIKGECLLNRGMISFTFMGEQRVALKDFEAIVSKYGETKFAEPALYYMGLIYYHLNASDNAKRTLEQYLQLYPHGKFRENVLSILKKLPGQ